MFMCMAMHIEPASPNKAVNIDAQGRPLATLATVLGRGLLLRYTSAGISFRA
jgi:hypothetical protein